MGDKLINVLDVIRTVDELYQIDVHEHGLRSISAYNLQPILVLHNMKFDFKTLDIEISQRIKSERQRLGLSQAFVGQDLGVSFQQLQKYENGANRITGSKLAALTKIYDVPVNALVPDLSLFGSQNPIGAYPSYSAEALELLRCFDQIKDQRIRQRIVALCKEYNAKAA